MSNTTDVSVQEQIRDLQVRAERIAVSETVLEGAQGQLDALLRSLPRATRRRILAARRKAAKRVRA